MGRGAGGGGAGGAPARRRPRARRHHALQRAPRHAARLPAPAATVSLCYRYSHFKLYHITNVTKKYIDDDIHATQAGHQRGGEHGGQLPGAGARRGGGVAGALARRRLPHGRGPHERHVDARASRAIRLPQSARACGEYTYTHTRARAYYRICNPLYVHILVLELVSF